MVVVTLVRLSAPGNACLSPTDRSSMAYLLALSGLGCVSPLNEAVAFLLCLLQIAVLTFARKAHAFVGRRNPRQMHQLMCGQTCLHPASKHSALVFRYRKTQSKTACSHADRPSIQRDRRLMKSRRQPATVGHMNRCFREPPHRKYTWQCSFRYPNNIERVG